VSLWLQGNALTGTVPPVIQDMEKLTSKLELPMLFRMFLIIGSQCPSPPPPVLIEELFLYNNNLTGNFVCPTRIEKCLVSCENYLNACRAL
jgi:hypothetical protein